MGGVGPGVVGEVQGPELQPAPQCSGVMAQYPYWLQHRLVSAHIPLPTLPPPHHVLGGVGGGVGGGVVGSPLHPF